MNSISIEELTTAVFIRLRYVVMFSKTELCWTSSGHPQ